MAQDYRCTALSLNEGRLIGALRARAANAPAPLLEVVARGAVVAVGDTVLPEEGVDIPFSIALPADILTDGVQTLLVRLQGDTQILGSLSIAVGEPVDQDIVAELDLLRAEIDMLKTAMRRHLGVTRY
jgi:hypothetical protein